MGRVGHQKSGRHGAAAPTTLRGHRAAKQQQRKKHKIVVEDLTGDKERSQKTVRKDMDTLWAGYTFIPAGNPELTSALKQHAKARNLEVLAVTTTPHASRYELSREVHRVGFHFPTIVVEEVCKYYGVELMSNGRLREDKDDDDFFRRIYHGDKVPREETKPDQVTINTEAKQIIKDLFPNIPDNDLFRIIKTAFQLGTGKVGTAGEIPLVRRAQLSVVAHIRHTYTNYDKLLRKVEYAEARHLVEEETLQKLVAWRGEHEDTKAMDDVLREVVVISDDEDSDDAHDQSQVYETDDVHVQPVRGMQQPVEVASGRPRSPIEILSDEESPRRYRYLPQTVRRVPVHDQPSTAVSRQQSRYARWDQARQEYRNVVDPVSHPQIMQRISSQNTYSAPAQSQQVRHEPIFELESRPQWQMDPPTWIVQQEPSTFVRGADGKLYERIVTAPSYVHADTQPRRAHTPPYASVRRFDENSRPSSPRVYSSTAVSHRRVESYDGDTNVLPSIEAPSPSTRRNPFEEPQQGTDHLPQVYRVIHHPGDSNTVPSLKANSHALQPTTVSDGEFHQGAPTQYVVDRRVPQSEVYRDQASGRCLTSSQENVGPRYVYSAADSGVMTRQPARLVEVSRPTQQAIVRVPLNETSNFEHRPRALPFDDRRRMFQEDHTMRSDIGSVYPSVQDGGSRLRYEDMRAQVQNSDGLFTIDSGGQHESWAAMSSYSQREHIKPIVYLTDGANNSRTNEMPGAGNGYYVQRLDHQPAHPLRDDYSYHRANVPY